MPDSSDYLPNAPAGWHALVPLTHGYSITQENEVYFQADMLPSTKFGIVNAYNNTTLNLDGYDLGIATATSSLPGLAIMVGSGAAGFPVQMSITLSRKGSWSVAGMNPSVVLPMPSPRFGTSIGSIFKHQAYIRMTITGMGVIGPGYKIVWIMAVGDPMIEYNTNSRLTKFVVKHGRVVDMKRIEAAPASTTGGVTTPATPASMKVKLFANTQGADFASAATGSIEFYGQRPDGYHNQSYSFTEIDSDWYATFPDPTPTTPTATPATSSTATPPATPFIPAAGDFYVLSTPIMSEDPRLMHEFNVKVDGDGMYMTNEQRYSLASQVIGVWVYDDVTQLQVPYVDDGNRARIHLPDEAQSEATGDATEFGGDFAAGLAAWGALVPTPTTMRLILYTHGGQPIQNFFSENLTGEFIKVGNEYFEIVGQPRADTIEISFSSITSGMAFWAVPTPASSTPPASTTGTPPTPASAATSTGAITIYQQKFWKIVELYTGYGASNSVGALWGGKISSIANGSDPNSYIVKWTAQEPIETLFLPAGQVGGFSTLPARFRDTATSFPGALPIDGYIKFADWRMVTHGVEFAITDMNFASGSGGVLISATVEGNPAQYAGAGSPVFVNMGEAYRNPFGLPQSNNTFTNLAVQVGQTTEANGAHANAQGVLLMYGYYSAGYYLMPTALDSRKRLAIANHSYGADDSAQMTAGVPQVWVSTTGGTTGTCYIQHGAMSRQTVFYKDTALGTLTMVSADVSSDPGWIERRQKAMVRCGVSNKIDVAGGVPSDAYMLTGMYGTLPAPAAATDQVRTFWPAIPLVGGGDSPYHSVRIQGYGGIETPLTRKLGFTVPTLTKHPVSLPIEVYEPVGTVAGGADVTICSPVTAKASSVIPGECGFDEVADDVRFQQIAFGQQLPGVAPSVPATHLEFSKARQVLSGVGQFNGHVTKDGNVILFYGRDTSRFVLAGSLSSINQNKMATFAVVSGMNIDAWGSPKYDKAMVDAAADMAVAAEWERPLMLAYDFGFANSLKLNADEYLLFGYGYATDASGASKDGVADYCFLGCYMVSAGGLKVGKTYKCYNAASGSSTVPSEDQSFFYYRPSHDHNGTAGAPEHSMDFGAEVMGIPTSTTTATDPAEGCNERFTRIIGGDNSDAFETGWTLAQDIIGVSMAENGTISVYMSDVHIEKIFCVSSCSAAGNWEIERDDAGETVYYATGTAPSAFKDLLFYFHGEILYCKKLSVIAAGMYATKQEELNKIPAGIVATNVVGHKISVNTDPSGVVTVFYLNKSGDVCASVSNSSGLTWGYLKDW